MEESQLTRSERREQRKQEQEEARTQEDKERRTSTRRTWTIVIISGIIIVAFLAWLIQNRPEDTITPDNTPGAVNPVTESDHTKGAPTETAKVTLIEFSDFQCPACGAYYPVVKQLVTEFQTDVQFVYRHLPLRNIHRNAELAARYAEAAGKQGKFFEMHNLLFENQTRWSDASTGNVRTLFEGYGSELGLDIEKLTTDANSKEIGDTIEAQRVDGIGAGVKGTPTFFLNGDMIESSNNPKTYDEFKTLIQNAIDNSTVTP